MTVNARGWRKSKWVRFFVGSLKPLSVARGRRRHNNRRRQSPLSANRDPNAGDDGDGGEHPDESGEVDVNASADACDDGVWLGEYLPVMPTIVVTEPDAEPRMVVARITWLIFGDRRLTEMAKAV